MACLNEGLRRSGAAIVASVGGQIDAVAPSALTEDPRANGQPDTRLSRTAVEAARRRAVKYVLLLEATTLRNGNVGGRIRVDPAEYLIVVGLRQDYSFQERTVLDAVIVDVETQRWVARLRRGEAGAGNESAGVAFVFPLPILLPIVSAETPGTVRKVCESLGEAIGGVLEGRILGQRSPRSAGFIARDGETAPQRIAAPAWQYPRGWLCAAVREPRTGFSRASPACSDAGPR